MARLDGDGIRVAVPAGWDGRIRRRDTPAAGRQPVTAHVASFPLPADVGDFGSGAVERMRFNDILVTLVEYTDESVGTALFASEGLPRQLRATDFDPAMLQRTLEGQSGVQRFFTEAGRAFCLYVVLGAHVNRHRAVAAVNDVLADLQVTD
jgi:hypothetical protein